MVFFSRFFLICLCSFGFCLLNIQISEAGQHGLSMHGDLKYASGFDHFDYVNPAAPKGGTLRLAEISGFDSLNPFILKGSSAPGLNALGQGLLYESLMVQSEDEPFSMYGLIASGVTVAPDRSSVTFTLNPLAHWHDGKSITAQDVKWTFDTLMSVGAPFFKAYFGDIDMVSTPDDRTVTFAIKNKNNRELPLVIAQMVVLPKHYWTAPGRNIAEGTLDPPLGSGIYKIGNVKSGMEIEYIRAENAWARNLNVNKGRYNFDRILFQAYRDFNVALEAFFAGNYDVRLENVAKLWATAYTASPVTDGRIHRAEIPHAQPVGMQAFVFNTRRPIFADERVRRAIGYAFDFEWGNKKLADSAYTRNDSYFENSDLASSGLPDGRELEILEEFRGKIPDVLFTTPFLVPQSDGSGNNRAHLKRASDLLERAGYKLGKDGIRINDKGVRLTFEFVDNNPAFERWIMPFVQNLKKIGVQANLRMIDPTQYQNRIQNFDFDMTITVFGQSDSPGNEQMDYWHSSKADMKGSRNLIGIKDPVVDALVQKIINAPTRAELVASTRALDRVLLHGNYVIPNWHYAKWRAAWWNGFHHPDVKNTKSLGIIENWWYEKP